MFTVHVLKNLLREVFLHPVVGTSCNLKYTNNKAILLYDGGEGKREWQKEKRERELQVSKLSFNANYIQDLKC